MEMLLYLVLAVVLYGFLADQSDRMVEREMRKRRNQGPELRLVVFPAQDAGESVGPAERATR